MPAMDLDGIDPRRLPRHVACVMDGNGRWATKRGLARTEGHRAGEEALLDAAKGAVELGLEWFTVFAFSTENWRRPHQEVRFLLSIIADDLLTRRRDELHDLGVRIRFAGRRDWRVPGWILRRMDETAELTKHNKAMTLTVAFNYGGRAEIVDAARALNFLLWEIAYSELVFMDVLWPDFRREHLVEAVREYQQRERRFGLTRGERDHDGLPS